MNELADLITLQRDEQRALVELSYELDRARHPVLAMQLVDEQRALAGRIERRAEQIHALLAELPADELLGLL